MSEEAQSPLDIWLEIGPAASVESGAEAAVTAAFDEVALGVRWEPVPGDRSLEAGAPRAAEASLHVHVASGEALSPVEVLRDAAPVLAQALAGVRRQLPGLPLGLVVEAREDRKRFAFGRTDTPDDIAIAVDSAISVADRDAAVWGWDSNAGAWRSL